MKKITFTNATIIPFYKKNPQDKNEVIKILNPNPNASYSSYIVSFNVETRVKDTAESKAKIFEKCTIFAKTEEQVSNLKNIIKLGAIVEVSGYEQRVKSEKDQKYYNNTIINSITPISSGIEEIDNTQKSDDDLPF